MQAKVGSHASSMEPGPSDPCDAARITRVAGASPTSPLSQRASRALRLCGALRQPGTIATPAHRAAAGGRELLPESSGRSWRPARRRANVVPPWC
eukprot:scaffold3344_cov138-Isochrysis_galbana.AAC.6